MIKIPENARRIIDTLAGAGYSASIVGGSVRDALLGSSAADYDITTSALPGEIKACFFRTVDTGMKHGTVTVLIDSEPYEVTTYRIDGEYRDSRHPESVSFTDKIELDLSRRDFTVNAMAYNERDGLVDPFGGRADLAARIIRAVGNPQERFTEDALRILRAIRFSAVLDFDIEDKTDAALRELAPRLAAISRERILVEWKKLLSGKRAYEVIASYGDVIEVFLPELYPLTMPRREAFYGLDNEERQLLLFASSSGIDGFSSAAKNLKMDNKMRDKGISVLNNLITASEVTDKLLREYLIGKDDSAALSAARVSAALGLCPDNTEANLRSLISDGVPRRESMLAIGGRELMAIGYRGADIGSELSRLLRAAALGECENTEEELIKLAKSHI